MADVVGKSLTLWWSKNGNTEKVARRIHETLVQAGIDDTIHRISKDLEVEYLDYNLVFYGAPVYHNLPPKPAIAFLERHKRRGVDILAAAPEKPGIAAVMYCTYGGGHTGYNEAIPMLKFAGQFFEHEGIRVADEWAVLGEFPEADAAYNRQGRSGVVAGRPSDQDLAEIEGRVLGLIRRLQLILPLGDVKF